MSDAMGWTRIRAWEKVESGETRREWRKKLCATWTKYKEVKEAV